MGTSPGKAGTKAKAQAPSGTRLVPLDLRAALAHLRPDRQSWVRLEGVPESIVLSAGQSEAGGSWLLTLADLDNLNAVAPASFRGQTPLSVVLVRRSAEGSGFETVSSFGVLLTPEGAVSAFSSLEPEERDGGADSVGQLRATVGKGRGKLTVKTVKRALDLGDGRATTGFVAQRSHAQLDALFRGELGHNPGASSETSVDIEQRLTLARRMWEGQAAQEMASARKGWDEERAKLTTRIGELEEQLHLTAQELAQAREGDGDMHRNVRAKLIDVVARLSDEHAAELAEIERRLRQEAEDMLAAARAEWECTGGPAPS